MEVETAGISPPAAALANYPAERLLITTVRNCVVTRSSLVVSARGVERACLFEGLPAKRRLEMNLVGIGSLVRNRLHRIAASGEYFHIFNIWGTGYHHWLTEVAPKLFLFREEIRRGKFLLPEGTPGFVFEFLNRFGFTNYLQLRGNTFFKTLNVVSNPNSGHYDIRHLGPLRAASLNAFGSSQAPATRKIYVTRRNSRGRKVVNDEHLSRYLASRGFEILDLENVPFSEQVRLFSETGILISIHGAALTNMLFMGTGSRIIEFYPEGFTHRDFFNACYRRLSSTLGIQHQYIFCGREYKDEPFDLHNDNIFVDLNKLGEMLAAF